MEIFESTPAKTNHKKRPTDANEFVYVLSGKLILTEPNGKSHGRFAGASGGLHRHLGDARQLSRNRNRGPEEALATQLCHIA